MMQGYPWYEVAENNELLQGQFISDCPVIVPPKKIALEEVVADVVQYDVIIMSQSCDLEQKKLELVLVCHFQTLSEFERKNPSFKSATMKESLRRGYSPGYHLLNKCVFGGLEDYLVVDFRSVYGVHFDFLVDFAKEQSERLCLLSPYKEHLSQAFARFFMRVALPMDIPPFG